MCLLDLDELPQAPSTATRCGPPAARRPCACGARDPWAIRRCRWPTPPATWWPSARGSAPPGRFACSRRLALLGVGFNPVSFYYLQGADGGKVEAVIAEVTSTPWGERHSYVLDGRDGALEGKFTKQLHVSPFMPMEQTYRWRLSDPGEALSVAITSEQEGRTVFSAGLALRRRELSRSADDAGRCSPTRPRQRAP